MSTYLKRKQAEERIRPLLPGLLPSGWLRLSPIVVRADGTAVMAYNSKGRVLVMVEAREDGHTITVSRRDVEFLAEEDLQSVRRLYRRAHMKFELGGGNVAKVHLFG